VALGVDSASRTHHFEAADWLLIAAVAVMWGSSFLFIELGVDHLRPELVAFGRVAFGALAIALIPAAWAAVPRSEWPALLLVGATWMAVPFLLFSVAQQSIDSSLAGMLNAATPLCTTLVAAFWFRRPPAAIQTAGLLVGAAGVVLVCWRSVEGAHATAHGVAFVLAATVLYGIAFNMLARLQERHGTLPVVLRSQLVALALLALPASLSVPDSDFVASSVLAVVALGVLGTGAAFVAFATLIGRVSAPRASVTLYFVPAVAIALGALLLDEALPLAAVLGTLLVLAGAWLVSRARAPSPGRRSAAAPGPR
jgi:drug/metabolite transporter (DMT)-like permease